jgi:hypothetical protein
MSANRRYLQTAKVLQAMFSDFTHRLVDSGEIECTLTYFASIPML